MLTVDAHRIFPFDHDHGVPARELAHLLGGKGAGLAEMTRALGIRVPPGFTISLPVCREYRDRGWPGDLDAELHQHVRALGDVMGRGLGDPHDPLLLAVRSGAPASMPGMLDTVLNLGLNDATVAGLARTGGARFAWDSYRRFLRMFATTVMGVPEQVLPAGAAGSTPLELQAQVRELQACVRSVCGRDVPESPTEQLRQAVEAVFRSWDCDRARTYRAKEGLSEGVGTAVNVQAMVFGNRGTDSGTGVVFTRDPSTGEPRLYGDYLPMAQGEDVVAGTAVTQPLAALAALHPEVHAELVSVLRRLEVHYRDVCDVEFTVEQGRLWLLQTRVGKRGAVAAVKTAVDLVHDPDIRLTPAEALTRVPLELRARARSEVLARCSSGGAAEALLAQGLGAAPGRVSGRIVLSSDAAADADDDVVLVRAQTSPEDVAGMAASVGILTTAGGLVSHAAVVARGWGIPAVVGAQELTIRDGRVLAARGASVAEGDVITIDGASGLVWKGLVDGGEAVDVEAALQAGLPELAELEQWARDAAGALGGAT